MTSLSSSRIVVVGATGAVGAEMLSILAERGVSPASIAAYGSARSEGRQVSCGQGTVTVRSADNYQPQASEIVLLAVDASTARELAWRAAQAGCFVVDNSSAFRAAPEVPLVIPEVNGELLSDSELRLVANPNCSAILLALALEPLRKSFGLQDVIVSTYQAASGAGQAAMNELQEQTRAVLAGEEPMPSVFPEPCAFNVFTHESDMDVATGWNGEERKMISELRRIFDDAELTLSPTCVRVPVLRAHSQSVTVTLSGAATEDEVRSVLSSGEGICLLDDRESGHFPTPLRATGKDDVSVGRLRSIPVGAKRTDRWSLWLSGDQLRKGAALNAIQCAEKWLAFNSAAD